MKHPQSPRPGRGGRFGAASRSGAERRSPPRKVAPRSSPRRAEDVTPLNSCTLVGAAEAQSANSHKRVLQADMQQPKLHKVLAQAGIGSRLEMEALIAQGRVMVNDKPAHVGQRVQQGDQIKVNGKPVRLRMAQQATRVLAYHKLAGEMVTRNDPQSRPTVFRKLPPLAVGKWQAVGRLDLNTEGLLLLTNSGDLANRLMHPRYGLEREYAVRILGALSDEERAQLLEGVQLEDGEAAFGSIQDGGGEGVNQWYRVTISEGRNREVRRMMEAVGHAVSRLIRIRYGSVVLMRGLRRGAWYELPDADVARLMDEVGLEPPVPMGRGRVRRVPDRKTGAGRSAPSSAAEVKSVGKPVRMPAGRGGVSASQGYIGEAGIYKPQAQRGKGKGRGKAKRAR